MTEEHNSTDEVFLKNSEVKEYTQKPSKNEFKPNFALKRIIFAEGWNYNRIAKAINEKGISCSRQYVYGVCAGRLIPSVAFAKTITEILGLKNLYSLFDVSQLHMPNFVSADKYEEKEREANEREK